MRIFGLIGHPLSHSFSKQYFTEKFEREGITDAEYRNYGIETIQELPRILQTDNPCGLNVTIPYKQAIMPMLGKLDETAQEVGAVNTIAINNGKLTGYNTDVIGFRNSIKPFLKPHHQRALVLGTGGAAKAVVFVLKQLGVDYLQVSRTPQEGQLSYKEVNEYVMMHHLFIINTTPLGMYPKIDGAPLIPYQCITDQHYLYDLVYNPTETEFLKRGAIQGADTQNGRDMLMQQAEASWNIWND